MSRPVGFKHTEETKRKMREHHARWNKGATKDTNPSVRKQSETLTKHWHNHPHPNIGKSGRKLSNETKRKMSMARRGNKNANWRGGLTEVVKGIRRSPEFYQWRKEVLGRDNHICRDCGLKENVNAHHLKSLIDYPELVFEVSNGLTLCEDCHKRHTAWQRLNGRRKTKSKRRT
jgi:hypothetical protein